MKKLIQLNFKIVIVLYVLADLICVGAGMGVPIFCILLGFPLGWYIAKRIFLSTGPSSVTYYGILKYSILAASFTFLLMLIIWSKTIPMLFDPSADYENFGEPLILYEPKMSFIGWVILMIFISPFLQLLVTIFAAFLTLMKTETKNNDKASSNI
jgi:hypothetical protein